MIGLTLWKAALEQLVSKEVCVDSLVRSSFYLGLLGSNSMYGSRRLVVIAFIPRLGRLQRSRANQSWTAQGREGSSSEERIQDLQES